MDSDRDADFLSLVQVAKKLQQHPKTLRRLLVDLMVESPALTVTRIGRSVLFTRAQLDELTKALEWRSPVADEIVRRRPVVRRHSGLVNSAQESAQRRGQRMLEAAQDERLAKRHAAVLKTRK